MARCAAKGPGPQYGLKSLTGWDDHDPQKKREPAYTMKFRHKRKAEFVTPGPYPVDGKMTQHGAYRSPAQTMVFKPRVSKFGLTPGPGRYAPEKGPLTNHQQRAPAYTMVFKHRKLGESIGPGPAYALPTCMGPVIPDIKAAGAVCMTFKHKMKKEHLGPGPAAYHTETRVFKSKEPAYSMKFRHKSTQGLLGPGPQYLYPIELYKKREPCYTIGVKYSPCATVGLMEKDED